MNPNRIWILGISLFLLWGGSHAFETQEVPRTITDKAKSFLASGKKIRRLCLPCGDTSYVEFAVQSFEVSLADSINDLYVLRVNDKGRSLAQIFIQKDSIWRNLAVLSGLNWPGTPDPLSTALAQTKQWKLAKSTSWAGAYHAVEWRPSRIRTQKIQVTHFLRIYSEDPQGSAKWFVDGPNIQQRVRCRTRVDKDGLRVYVENYFPEHYGKKKKKGKLIFTLTRNPKGAVATRWEKEFTGSKEPHPARFTKVSPNPYQTWE